MKISLLGTSRRNLSRSSSRRRIYYLWQLFCNFHLSLAHFHVHKHRLHDAHPTTCEVNFLWGAFSTGEKVKTIFINSHKNNHKFSLNRKTNHRRFGGRAGWGMKTIQRCVTESLWVSLAAAMWQLKCLRNELCGARCWIENNFER